MKIITSTNNQIIKEIDLMKKASARKKSGLIFIDGAREIEMAVAAKIEISTLFYCPALITGEIAGANSFFGIDNEKIIEVSEAVLNKISYKENPDGFLAIAKPRLINLKELKLEHTPLLVILEAVEKPGNLGAIIRTAYAAGADAIIINDSQTDIYNPNVIRASEGFIFKKPIVMASVSETQAWLKVNKILSYAAATSGKNNYTKEKMDIPLALVLGSEADGLSDKWLKQADKLVKIPMVKGIDSLNVSVSAAILLYEAIRQRAE